MTEKDVVFMSYSSSYVKLSFFLFFFLNKKFFGVI